MATSSAEPFYRELPDGRIEHRAEPLIFVLALLVIPAIIFEEATASWLRTTATVMNITIWLGFAAELAFVLTVSTHRRRTLRAHWLDAFIVAVSGPFLPAYLQSARALRLLRLLRLMRLAAVSARVFHLARRLFQPSGFRYVAVVALLLVVIAGATEALVESKTVHSIQDGIWWAITTVTTVGYGDIAPTTLQGRAIAAVVMLVGISFFALLTATVSATFVKGDRPDEAIQADLKAILQRLERLERGLLDDTA